MASTIGDSAISGAAVSTSVPRVAAAPLAHGGNLAQARRLFPGAPEPFLDLSTGINPVPYPLPPFPSDCFTRLPEPASLAALEAAAAATYGVRDAACVVAAPGTQILIDLIPRLWPLPSVAILSPTYAEHAHAWGRAGAQIIATSVIDGLKAGVGAVLCNPNNPNGRRVAPKILTALADRLADRGGLLVVDEAFADLEGDDVSVASALPHPALLVLRSFGKTYGLAGVRLGFALASAERAGAIRAALGPWAVSGPAIEAGRCAFSDPSWREVSATRLSADAVALDEVLREGGPPQVWGCKGGAVFSRLLSNQGWTRGLDGEAGKNRG